MSGGGGAAGHPRGAPGAPGLTAAAFHWIAMLALRPQGAGFGAGLLAVVEAGSWAGGGLPGVVVGLGDVLGLGLAGQLELVEVVSPNPPLLESG